MTNIIHRIGIKAPPANVYAAVSTVEGIARWWTAASTGRSERGGQVQVRFHAPTGTEIGAMTFVLHTLTPDREVRWRLTAGPQEWVDTEVTFELSQEGDMTILLFGHRGWREASEFTAHCSMKWATFLLSLRDWVETGQGRPAPHDLKIDNWN